MCGKKNRLIDGFWSSEISLDLISASPRSSLPSTTISICCSDRSIARWKDLKIDGSPPCFLLVFPLFCHGKWAQPTHPPRLIMYLKRWKKTRSLWGISEVDWIFVSRPLGIGSQLCAEKKPLVNDSCGVMWFDNCGSTVYLLRMGWWSQSTCMFFACVETTHQQCKGPERDCWVTCSDKC